ncbi:MAG: T9SS type A sorting domain-containing protein [Bacteroidales bacterium]|nr:T9SS type A sorting domain-containing protein [Bacteroidales bacterium]
MKRILKLVFLHLLPISLYCQSYYFNNMYQSGSGVWSGAISIIEVDEGYLIGGTTGTPPNSSWHQITLSVLDKYGNKIYEKLIGDTISEYYLADKAFITTNDGLITFAGIRRSYPQKFNHDEILLIKLDNEYDTIYSKCFGEKELPYDTSYIARQIIETSYNNLVIVGTLTPEVNYRHQILLLKISSTGNFIWEELFIYPNINYSLFGFSVIETPDKGFAIGAYRYKPGFSYTGEPMVYKVDSLGNEEWFISVGGPYYDTKSLLCNAYDGDIIEANCYADSMSGSWDAYRTINIKKINLEGDVIWDKRYGGSEYNKRVSNIRQTNDGGYIATGYTATANLGYPYPHFSGWMLKINNEGDSLWYRLYYNLSGSYESNYLYDIISTSDNGFAACGEVFGPSTNYTQHAWVIKVDSMGCDTPGCITTVISEELLVNSNEGLKVWPNPTTGKFEVRFSYAKASENESSGFWVEGTKIIRIYNSQGLRVDEIEVPKNVESLQIDASKYSNGLYYLQYIHSNRIMETVKFIKN